MTWVRGRTVEESAPSNNSDTRFYYFNASKFSKSPESLWKMKKVTDYMWEIFMGQIWK